VSESGQIGASASVLSRDGEWVVTLDVEQPQVEDDFQAELVVRALAIAVAGSRTYIASRTSGYSFTVIVGTPGAEAALSKGLALLAAAQARAGLPVVPVVCAEVTLVGTRPVPAAERAATDCENPAS
jgi:hypothetical protein